MSPMFKNIDEFTFPSWVKFLHLSLVCKALQNVGPQCHSVLLPHTNLPPRAWQVPNSPPYPHAFPHALSSFWRTCPPCFHLFPLVPRLSPSSTSFIKTGPSHSTTPSKGSINSSFHLLFTSKHLLSQVTLILLDVFSLQWGWRFLKDNKYFELLT